MPSTTAQTEPLIFATAKSYSGKDIDVGAQALRDGAAAHGLIIPEEMIAPVQAKVMQLGLYDALRWAYGGQPYQVAQWIRSAVTGLQQSPEVTLMALENAERLAGSDHSARIAVVKALIARRAAAAQPVAA